MKPVDTTKYKLKGIRKANKLLKPTFWYPEIVMYRTSPTEYIRILYQSCDGNKAGTNAYFFGRFVGKPNSLTLTYTPLVNGWSLFNGEVTYKGIPLAFNHVSQILVNNGRPDSGEATLDVLVNELGHREQLPLWFEQNNIAYSKYTTKKDTWVYSKSNNTYYNGVSYHYSRLEDLAHDLIKEQFPEVWEKSAHTTYGRMMKLAITNKLITDSKDTFPFENRVRLANYFKLTPKDK